MPSDDLTLRTARLSIAPVDADVLDDAQALFEVLADPALGWWTGEAAPADVDEVRERIPRLDRARAGRSAVAQLDRAADR